MVRPQWPSMAAIGLIALLGGVLVACTGRNSRATPDGARGVAMGMSQAEVGALLGQPTESISGTAPVVNVTYTTWIYKGKNGSPEIVIGFENGKVVAVKLDDRQIVGR